MADSPPGVDLLARFLLTPNIPSPSATAVDCLTGATIPCGPASENPPGSGRYIAAISGADLPEPTRVRVTMAMTGGLAAAVTHYQIGPIAARSQKRPAIRQRILGRLYDEERLPGYTCTVTTADVSGGTAEPIVIGGEGEFRGFVVWFQDGRNMNAERLVTGYTTSTRRLDWTPSLPLAPYPGEHFELSPMRVTRLNRAIDDVLEELRDQWLRPAADSSILTDGVAVAWPLPEDFRLVGRVGLRDVASGRLVGWLSPSQWAIGPNRTLRLTGGWGSLEPNPMGWEVGNWGVSPLPHGLRLHVEGHVALPPIVDDEQVIDAPIEALIDTAALNLAQGMERHRPVLPYMSQKGQPFSGARGDQGGNNVSGGGNVTARAAVVEPTHDLPVVELLETRMQARLATLRAERETFLATAQRQLAAFDAAIGELDALLKPDAARQRSLEQAQLAANGRE